MPKVKVTIVMKNQSIEPANTTTEVKKNSGEGLELKLVNVTAKTSTKTMEKT